MASGAPIGRLTGLGGNVAAMTNRAFEALIARAQACRLCPAMKERRRVLSAANGGSGASVLFVGEAHGRLDAERSGNPFHGDQSGRSFERFLDAVAWAGGQARIT